MRKLLIQIVLILVATSCSKEERIDLSDSPFQLSEETNSFEESFECNCLDYSDNKKDYCVFSTSTIDDSFRIEYWSGYINQWETRPYLVSQDCIGNNIDTLFLTKKYCYNGTDSSFNPQFSIDENLEITGKSSSTYTEYGEGKWEMREGKLVYMITHKSYLFKTTDHYNLNLSGYFKSLGTETTTETTSNYPVIADEELSE
jgi:hypothetical protein